MVKAAIITPNNGIGKIAPNPPKRATALKTQNDLVRTKSFYCIHFTTALPDAIAMVPTNINEKEGRSYNRSCPAWSGVLRPERYFGTNGRASFLQLLRVLFGPVSHLY